MNRRDFLRLVGAGSLAAACGDGPHPGGTGDAVAILEPDPDAFLIAVWSSSAAGATVDITAGGSPVASLAVAIDVASGRGVVDVTSLVPDTVYQVVVTTDAGVRLGPHTVRTAPADDATRAVRIAVSADWDPSPEFVSDVVDHVVAAEPELYVSIGDNPYTDNGPPAMDVPVYRQRHAELRTDPKARALHEACGWRAIYDDHEFRNDWDHHFEIEEADRFAAAMQVWDEFFPLRNPRGDIRYRTFRWGAHVEGFLLDCRRFRSSNADPDDANKTMLGATQLAWFLDAIARSTATFKLVFTSIPLDFGNGVDHWAAYTYERQIIFDALVAKGITGVLFVSGDQHWFAAHRHAYGIREFQIGPVARGFGMPIVQAPGVLFRSVQFNFGIVEIDGTSLTFSGLGPDGTRFYSETLTVDDLTPRRDSGAPLGPPS
jgi:alkaline phosphatase D